MAGEYVNSKKLLDLEILLATLLSPFVHLSNLQIFRNCPKWGELKRYWKPKIIQILYQQTAQYKILCSQI